jgi:hypothetical protein
LTRKDKEKRRSRRRFPEVSPNNFYLYLIGQNIVIWSHLVAKEDGIIAFSWTKQNETRFSEEWRRLPTDAGMSLEAAPPAQAA